MLARDPDTGAARWFYQFSPHDHFDHDGVNENVLVDLPADGRTRKVILHPERNGYVYVMDRTAGEVLSATPFIRVTASKGVDLDPSSPTRGRLVPNMEKMPKPARVIRDIAPIHAGAKDWQPSSYSPDTGLLYIPHQTMTMDWEAVEANYIEGKP